MNPHTLAAQLRAQDGFDPSSRTGSVVLLLELLPEDATPAQVDEVTAGLLPAGPAVVAGFAARVRVGVVGVDEILDTEANMVYNEHS